MKTVFMVLIAGVIGGSISSLSLLPLVRPLFHKSIRARNISIFAHTLLAFLVASPGWTYLSCLANFKFSQEFMYNPSVLEGLQENRFRVTKEIWLRQMVPFQFSQTCYAEDAEVCGLADQFVATPNDAWLVLVQGTLAGIIFGINVRRLARTQKGSRASSAPASQRAK